MYKSKLFQLLKTLNNIELKEFARYCAFKDDKLTSYQTKLIQYITSSESFIDNRLDKRQAYSAVYNNTEYNEPKLKDVMSKLVNLYFEFIGYKEFQNNTSKHTLEALNKKGINKEFDKLLNKQEKALTKSNLRDIKFYESNYELASLEQLNFQQKNLHTKHPSLQKKMNNLDIYFIASKLKTYCQALNYKIILKVDYTIEMIDEIFKFLEKENNIYKEIPTIACYYHTAKMIQNESEIHLNKLLNILIEFKHHFDISEVKELYTFASSFCIQQLNKGNTKYSIKQLNLYKQMLEENILHVNGILSQWTFLNIVTLALRNRQYDWTKTFINSYIKDLKEEEQENALTYNKANYFYANKEYDKAQDLLLNVDFGDGPYGQVARSLLLKIYFETKETDLFPYHVEAFYKHITRNKLLSEYNKETYKNQIKYTEKLFNILNFSPKLITKEQKQKQLADFKQQVVSVKQIQNLDWLLNQIETASH